MTRTRTRRTRWALALVLAPLLAAGCGGSAAGGNSVGDDNNEIATLTVTLTPLPT